MKNTFTKLLPLIILLFVVLGCNLGQKSSTNSGNATPDPSTGTAPSPAANLTTISARDGSCEIKVPSHMSEANDLNTQAILQASNPKREIYVMVIDDSTKDFSKSTTIDKYATMLQDDVKKRLQDAEFSSVSSSTIGDLDSREFDATGGMGAVQGKFKYAIVKTDDNFYQIISWTLPTKYDENKAEMEAIVKSFKVNEVEKSDDKDKK